MLGNHRDRFVRNLFASKVKSMNEYGTELAVGSFKMPSLAAVCEKKLYGESNLEQKIAKANVIRLNEDINDDMNFFDEETKIVDNTIMPTEELNRLRNDNTDFHELRFELNEDVNMPPKLQSLPSDPDAMSNWDDAKSLRSIYS